MYCICCNCVGDASLKSIIRIHTTAGHLCNACGVSKTAVPISFVAKECDKILDLFYEESSKTDAVRIYGRTPDGEPLQEIIAKLVIADEDVVEAVVLELYDFWKRQSVSERNLEDEDLWFVETERIHSTSLSEWHEMEISLRSRTRFLNPEVERLMEELFGDIETATDSCGDAVIIDAGPNTSTEVLYRARVFYSESKLVEALNHPEKYLGAPVEGIGGGGRMNAAGLPTFYGARNEETAISEVRPAVGGFVATAAFRIVRPLKILNLNKLRERDNGGQGSKFDPTYRETVKRRRFLAELSRRMVMPVLPGNEERSYLITQVISDYLATHPSNIDGIIYPSVQQGGGKDEIGENIVLFSKASATYGSNAQSETATADLYRYEDEERWFSPNIHYRSEGAQYSGLGLDYLKNSTLSLIRDSIYIHKVHSVKVLVESANVEVEA